MSGNIEEIMASAADGVPDATYTCLQGVPLQPNVVPCAPAFNPAARDCEALDNEREETSCWNLEEPFDLENCEYLSPRKALEYIDKGRATGNRLALRTRAVIDRCFFVVGQFAHRHAGCVLVIGLIILCLGCLGLPNIQLETRLDRLWMEEGGRLEAEQQYTDDVLHFSTGANSQVLLQTPSVDYPSVLTPEALLFHLELARIALSVEVTMYWTTFKWSNICQTLDFPNFDERSPVLSSALEELTPCSIVTPLDCFWEGSKLLGPKKPVQIPVYGRDATWATLDLERLVHTLENNTDPLINSKPLVDFLDKAEVEKGYVGKPCLNPRDAQCPDAAPNKRSGIAPNVADAMQNGCYGISSKYRHWMPDQLLANVTRNASGHIQSASAIQTIFHIGDAERLFLKYEHMSPPIRDYDGSEWKREMAVKVIATWQAKYHAAVEEKLKKNNTRAKSSIGLLAEGALAATLVDCSKVNLFLVIAGHLLAVVYMGVVSRNCADSVDSYSGVAVAGTLLISLTVAGGMGYCSFFLSFNILSTQVIPLVALVTHLQHVLQMTSSITEVVRDHRVERKDIGAECLARNGASILFSTLAMSGAFFAGYAIPLPALRWFSIQMGIVVLLGGVSLLLLLPAVIYLDQQRRPSKRCDLFCCYTQFIPKKVPPTSAFSSSYFREGIGAVKGRPSLRQNDGGATCCLSTSTLRDRVLTTYLRLLPCGVVKFVAVGILITTVGFGVCGIRRMEAGLEMAKLVPTDTLEHRYFRSQARDFHRHQAVLVTKEDFAYEQHQEELYALHDAVSRVKGVVRSVGDGAPRFWLADFRDWLLDIEASFEHDYREGCFGDGRWYENASDNAILGFKLRAATLKDHRLVAQVLLVDEHGRINPDGFYSYMSAWVSNDPMGYAATQAHLHPQPVVWLHDPEDPSYDIPESAALHYAQMPFVVSGLNSTDDAVGFIEQVQSISQVFAERGVPSFPSGQLFTYWEQYVDLRFNMVLALGILLAVLCMATSVLLMNLWAAVVVTATTVVFLLGLAGCMAWLRIDLNAISASLLVYATGVAWRISFPICAAFLSGFGGKDRRVRCAMARCCGSIVHGAVASLIATAPLYFTKFQFIFQYFFLILAISYGMVLLNSLVNQPVVLSLLGPGPDLIANYDPEHPPPGTPDPLVFLKRHLSIIMEEDETASQPAAAGPLETQVVVRTTATFSAAEPRNSVCEKPHTASVTTTVRVELHRPSFSRSLDKVKEERVNPQSAMV
ncbi:protein patched homolog 1-like [Paramacrobiotus metropolitanus]|uniref:protein patched homolog 1-like n=1 Tax=Paramacrobiotus metropolitanus TaxID=2943436 RepID=UPI0024458872|nr:protein patched homolog 1-like [Paramacrobiotus metropolitanus]